MIKNEIELGVLRFGLEVQTVMMNCELAFLHPALLLTRGQGYSSAGRLWRTVHKSA